jgi:hypothetical protein
VALTFTTEPMLAVTWLFRASATLPLASASETAPASATTRVRRFICGCIDGVPSTLGAIPVG